MALNDDVLASYSLSTVAASSASEDQRVLASAGGDPDVQLQIFDFDADADEHVAYDIQIGANLTAGKGARLKFQVGASTATAGNMRLGAAFKRIVPDTTQLGVAHTWVYQEVTQAPADSTDKVVEVEIDFTSAQMDSLAAGESGVLMIRRNGDDAADTMLGDMELHVNRLSLFELA